MTWISSETRESQLRKLSETRYLIAYSSDLLDDELLNDYYQHLVVNPESYLRCIFNVNSFRSVSKFKKKTEEAGNSCFDASCLLTGANNYIQQVVNASFALFDKFRTSKNDAPGVSCTDYECEATAISAYYDNEFNIFCKSILVSPEAIATFFPELAYLLQSKYVLFRN